MSLVRLRLGSATLALSLLVIPYAVPHAGKGDELPYSVAVQVARSEHSGPEEMRREVELVLVQRIAEMQCFREAVRWDGDPQSADLLLRTRLLDLEDETRYDIEMAQRDDPKAKQEVKRLFTIFLRADILMEVVTLPGEAVVRSRSVAMTESYRPIAFEDPRMQVELQLVDEAVDTVAAFVCKGSAKKLDKEVAQARGH
jgi:hypothetical protein